MWGSFSKFEEIMFTLTFWLGMTGIIVLPIGLIWFLVSHLKWVW